MTASARPSAAGHASELELHELSLGALPAARRGAVEAHLRGCVVCSEALESLRDAHREFETEVHSRTVHHLADRARREQRTRLPRWAQLVAVPAAAAALLWMVGARLTNERPAGEPDLRTKGPVGSGAPTSLELFARRGDQVFAVSSNTPLRAGDAVRFVVRRPPELDQLLVVGIDANRRVTVYHPYQKETSAPTRSDAGKLELDGSIVLDAGPGPERVFAFFGREPIRLARVKPALEALAAGGAGALRARSRADVTVDGQSSVLVERDPQ